MASESVAKKRRRPGGHGQRVLGMMALGGEWRYVVQGFATKREGEAVLCRLARLEDLKGSMRRKAERWAQEMRPLGGA